MQNLLHASVGPVLRRRCSSIVNTINNQNLKSKSLSSMPDFLIQTTIGQRSIAPLRFTNSFSCSRYRGSTRTFQNRVSSSTAKGTLSFKPKDLVDGTSWLYNGFGGHNEEKVSYGKYQLERKKKQSSSFFSGSPDLLLIPGVGPRNLRKLVDKGFGGVTELKQLYKDKFLSEPCHKMVEFLQESVGIIHRNHAESISTFIKESVTEELKEEGFSTEEKSPQKKRITFCVEGNISVGKTTFLQRIAKETLELQDLVEVVPEPISKWQDIGPEHFNILNAFYEQPQRYAYTFQNYVFVTRVMQERESASGTKPLRLMERSVFTDRMVFVRAVHEANWMNEMEISIFNSWFDPVVSCLPGLIPDGFIYLRASPESCHARLIQRKRLEEGGVSLDYLRSLHEKHESWLFPTQSGNHGVLTVNQLPLNDALHSDLRNRVFYLEGAHMHPSIQKVPALILDCESTIDFSKDVEAKQMYAHQVAQFFEFVKKNKSIAPSKVMYDGKQLTQQLLIPQRCGL